MTRYNRRDRYYQKAKDDQYAARSVYKLEEIDRRHRLIKPGHNLVDLGSSPGSWLQYLSKAVGKKGAIVGYDLVEPSVNPGPQARTFVASVDELTPERVQADLQKVRQEIVGASGTPVVDGLVSDMAPKLTGVRDADQVKSVGLATQALLLAEALVRPDGYFVAKLFQGREIDELVQGVKRVFAEVKMLKPEATRDGSREAFIIGRGRRPLG